MIAHISFILEPPFEIGLIVAEICDWYVKLNGPDLLGDGPDGRTAGHANIWRSKVLHLWQNAGHLEPIRLAMQPYSELLGHLQNVALHFPLAVWGPLRWPCVMNLYMPARDSN